MAEEKDAGWPKDRVEDIFNYHQPSELGIARIGEIREAAKAFARIILSHTPKCADQAASLRKVREAMMTANAAIVLEGRNIQ